MYNVAENLANAIQINDHFRRFCKEFHLFQLFKSCNMEKKRGFSVPQIFSILFLLIFMNKNLYRYIKDTTGNQPDKAGESETKSFRYDTAYRFLQRSSFHWRKLLLRLSSRISRQFILPLNNPSRVTVFVIDDTLLERACSKKVEKLAYNHDHTTGEAVKSHVMVNLLWTDGFTNLPVAFSLVSSAKNYVDQLTSMKNPALHPSSLSYQRREESILPKPELALSLLGSAIKNGISADYVLYDSWFAYPPFIGAILHQYHTHSICMLSRSKTHYQYGENLYNLDSLYEIFLLEKEAEKKQDQYQDKKPANSKALNQSSGSVVPLTRPIRVGEDLVDYLGSMEVCMKDEEGEHLIPVKIVFVENRKKNAKREWLAILSTDTSLTESEIIRIYGRRWNIEVFHKSIKSILKVEKEFILRNFDSIIAYITITCIRFCFLSWMGRSREDQRTCGEMFYEFYDEMRDIQFSDAIERIMQLFVTFLSEVLHLPISYLNSLLTLFLSTLPRCILDSLGVIKCET